MTNTNKALSIALMMAVFTMSAVVTAPVVQDAVFFMFMLGTLIVLCIKPTNK